LFSGF